MMFSFRSMIKLVLPLRSKFEGVGCFPFDLLSLRHSSLFSGCYFSVSRSVLETKVIGSLLLGLYDKDGQLNHVASPRRSRTRTSPR
jgi:hypothetical protein